MIVVARTSSRHRIICRRPSEQGLTLIELLISITLLVVLTAFLAGGMSMARRAFHTDQISTSESQKRAALQTLSNLIGSAMPVHPAVTTQAASGVIFDGRQDGLSFLGLSEGRALTGGVYQITLRRSGDELTADFTAWSVGSSSDSRRRQPNRVVLVRGVRAVRLHYFGHLPPNDTREWHNAWGRADHLPDLVSIDLEFVDQPEGVATTLVSALRQG